MRLVRFPLSTKLWRGTISSKGGEGLRQKIGVFGATLLLVGAFLPKFYPDAVGSGFLLPLLDRDFSTLHITIILTAIGCLFASLRDMPKLHWLASFTGTVCLSLFIYQAFQDMAFIRTEHPSYTAIPGVAWHLMFVGIVIVLISSVLSFDLWGIREKVDALSEKPGSETGNANHAHIESSIDPQHKTRMRFAWSDWSNGSRIIFVASCLALFSFFLPWVDIGFASRNGFSQGGFLLGALYIYPLYRLLTSQRISKAIGLICATGAVVGAVFYYVSKDIEFLGSDVNAASTGVEVFMIATVMLAIGVLSSKATHQEANTREPEERIDGSVSGPLREGLKVDAEIGRVACPMCAELIMPEAKICRFCKSNLTGT